MAPEVISKKYLFTAAAAVVILGSMAVCMVFSFMDEEQTDSSVSFQFTSSIDSMNNTITMVEHNKTVNWGEYLVVVNSTFIMKKDRYSVPGVSTTFYNIEWDPVKGCCYDVEVVDRSYRKAVWNGTVEASR
jgi:hypothetical protein